MGYIPDSINGVNIEDLATNFQSCLDTKGTLYNTRISAGLKYSNSDLLRLELIVYFLNYDAVYKIGLDCIYDETPFPGVVQNTYSDSPIAAAGNLQSLINFAVTFCHDCITSNSGTATITTTTNTKQLVAENGTTQIVLENGSPIIL